MYSTHRKENNVTCDSNILFIKNDEKCYTRVYPSNNLCISSGDSAGCMYCSSLPSVCLQGRKHFPKLGLINSYIDRGFCSFPQYIQTKTGHDHLLRNSLVLVIHISLPLSHAATNAAVWWLIQLFLVQLWARQPAIYTDRFRGFSHSEF